MDGDGSTWQSPFTDLQDALSKAEPGDEIWVAQGIYYPTDSSDRTIHFGMRSDVAVYGGFAGTEDQLNQRDYLNNRTILSGNIGDPDLSSDNSFNVVRAFNIEVKAILDGFLIREGNATDPEPFERGGGMFSKNAIIEVRNCIFTENTASYGGGVYNLGSTTAYYYNCKIINNTAVRVGGGIYNFLRCETVIDRSIIADNEAIMDFAGAMYNFQSSMGIHNSLVSFNKAPSAGTFYMTNFSEVQFFNTNVVFNESESYPVFNLELASNANFYNSFFWENPSELEEGPMYFTNPESTISNNNSLIDGIHTDSDTTDQIRSWISSDEVYEAYRSLVDDKQTDDVVLSHPLFTNNGDLTYNSFDLDILGNERISDDQIDIGMLEYVESVTTSTKEEFSKDLIFYPNPISTDQDLLFVESYSFRIKQIEIYNSLGAKLSTLFLDINFAKDVIQIRIPYLEDGAYTLRFISDDHHEYSQILIVVK